VAKCNQAARIADGHWVSWNKNNVAEISLLIRFFYYCECVFPARGFRLLLYDIFIALSMMGIRRSSSSIALYAGWRVASLLLLLAISNMDLLLISEFMSPE
jgi:hypothetical protein